MKVTIDKGRCIGCGVCQSLCGECFQLNGDTAIFVGGECKDCNLEEVADSCPVDAIKIEESDNN
ncbi:MAG: ferredoxin [Candidatus Moraniibacteriota bacterium]